MAERLAVTVVGAADHRMVSRPSHLASCAATSVRTARAQASTTSGLVHCDGDVPVSAAAELLDRAAEEVDSETST